MGKKIYVGNLPFSATDQSLAETFKGFGTVEMSSDAEAAKAISELNGKDNDGRAMTVNEAKPMAPRESRGGGGRY